MPGLAKKEVTIHANHLPVLRKNRHPRILNRRSIKKDVLDVIAAKKVHASVACQRVNLARCSIPTLGFGSRYTYRDAEPIELLRKS